MTDLKQETKQWQDLVETYLAQKIWRMKMK